MKRQKCCRWGLDLWGLGFFCYEVYRKNRVAMIPTALFSLCHVLYGICNFVL